MFEYFKAARESFYFVPAVEPDRLIVFNTKRVHENIMYPLIKCVLVRSCILPIGEFVMLIHRDELYTVFYSSRFFSVRLNRSSAFWLSV